jgi:hypothetical protein
MWTYITYLGGTKQSLMRLLRPGAIACLDRLMDFFNRLPQVVRGEMSLVIAALSRHEFIDLSEDFDLEYDRARPVRSTNTMAAPWRPDQCRCHVGRLFRRRPEAPRPLLVRYDRLCLSQKNSSKRLAIAAPAVSPGSKGRERIGLRWTGLTTAALSAARASN